MAPWPAGLPGLRSVRRGGSVLLTSFLTLGVLAMVSWLGVRRHARFDLTAENRFSLSPQTRQILAGLDRPVSLMAFYPASDPAQVPLRRLLEQYEAASNRVTFQFVDPDQQPGVAARHAVHEPGLVVVTPDRRERARSDTEEGITNALLRALRNRAVVVGFLAGHGERDAAGRDREGLSSLVAALGEVSYTPTRVTLLAAGSVPDSVNILVIAGPRADPLPAETAAIDVFLRRGGRLLVLLDPAPGVGLNDFLKSWGAIVGDDAVVDPKSGGRMAGMDAFAPLVTRYDQDSPITRGFDFALFFPGVRSVGLPEALPKGARGWTLFKSGSGSWAETGPLGGRIQLDPGADRLGPIPLAVAVQHPPADGPRLVVFGDSDFVTNRIWRLPGTGDLFLNALAWLAERAEEIAVRAPSLPERRVELTALEARAAFAFGVVLFPLAILGAGAWVGWRRRDR